MTSRNRKQRDKSTALENTFSTRIQKRRRPLHRAKRPLLAAFAIAVVGTAIANLVSYFYPGLFNLLPPLPWTPRKVAVAIDRSPSNSWILSDRPIASYGVPPTDCGSEQWRQWLEKRGGIPSGEANIYATLTSYRPQSVVIESISVDSVMTEPLPLGTNIGCPEGDALEIRVISINLDAKPPTIEYLDEQGRRLPRFAFTLRPGEVERFLLIASGEESTYHWSATITLLEGTERRKVRIADDGRPFTVVSRAIGPSYEQFGQRWEEVRPSG